MSHFHAIVAYAELCFVLGAALPAKPPQAPAPPQAPCRPAPAAAPLPPPRWEPDPDGTADLGLWRGAAFQGRYVATTGQFLPWAGTAYGAPAPIPADAPRAATDSATNSPGNHCHRCTHCGHVWCHGDNSHGNLAAHLCPACGRGPHWQPVARPAVVQPTFAPMFGGSRFCPGGG